MPLSKEAAIDSPTQHLITLARTTYFPFMLDSATTHLHRLETLLAAARADYDTLAYIILEGMSEITIYTRTRQVSLPVSGDDAGHFNGMLAEATLARIAALEQEIAETHGRIAQEATEQQRDATEWAGYRRQARAAACPPTRRKRGNQSIA